MNSTITALPEFLKELDESLKVIPNDNYIPTRSHPDMTPMEHYEQIDRLTKEFGDYQPTVFEVSRQHKETGEMLTFCGLANIGVSEERAIALAHLLTNIHMLRNLIDRYDAALGVAAGALVSIQNGANMPNEVCRRAINEIAAIKEHPVTK